jgi:tRNA pseudouridine13 synthase
MCLKLLNEVGFINYHESQEFGNPGNKHLIGKDLILERWQEVIRYGKGLIVEPWLVFKNPRNIALACFEYKSSRNVDKDLGMEQYEKEPKPIKIISSIKLRGKNLTKALKTVFYLKSGFSYTNNLLLSYSLLYLQGIPLDLRISNVRAYQCFIWNKIVSKRIAKFGVHLIIGDLVLAQGHNKQDNQPEIIFIDDGNIHKFTIYDVVLPLPQHDTVYPANEIAGWYNDVFQEDGISEKDFNLSSKYNGNLMLFTCIF